MFTLKEIFKYQKDNDISDIHIISEEKLFARNHQGDLLPFSEETLNIENMQSFLNELCTEEEKEEFTNAGNLDKAKTIEGVGRFRINIFTERRGIGMNFRIIPEELFDSGALQIPPNISKYALRRSGLILISGPNNSGKTTLVNGLIDLINKKKKCKIVTFEDPVEYIHVGNQALISQHEITDSNKQKMQQDLRSIFRQDADVILIGEIRDALMMNIALEMCETGYLVLATIHGTDSVQTLERISNLFPADNRIRLYKQLSHQLKLILFQTLIPNKENKLVPCREIMIESDGIKNLIQKGDFNELYRQMETDSLNGNILFDQNLIKLYKEGLISQETIVEYCHNKSFILEILK